MCFSCLQAQAGNSARNAQSHDGSGQGAFAHCALDVSLHLAPEIAVGGAADVRMRL